MSRVKVLNHVHPDDRDYVDDAFKQALKGKPLKIDFRIVLVDSVESIVNEQAEIVLDEKNNPVQMIGTVQDITELKKVEEALRASETRFRSLYENSLDGILLTKPDGTILSANPQACSFFGMTEDEIIKAGRDGLVVDKEKLAAALEDRNRTGRAKAELTLKRKNGSTFVGEVLSSLFVDSEGIIKSSLIIRDITERKQKEEALWESEERFRTVIENSRDGINMLDLKTGRYVLMSPAQMEMTGFTAEEMNNISAEEVYERVHPEDRDVSKFQLKPVSAEIDTPSTVEYRWKVKNGEYRWFSDSRKLVRDAQGNPVALVGVSRDITERKQTEEKIRYLANILESSNDAIITKSLDGTITSWNKGAEQIYGYSAEEILGKDISILEPEDLKGEIKQLSDKVKQGQKILHYETLRLKKDGTKINVSVALSPVFDLSGRLAAISVIARDITERKKAEESLAKMEAARNKEIHHRIKNNLQVISSLLDLAAEKFMNKNHLESAEVLEAFRDSQNRIISIALIHKELHEDGGLNTLNFSLYLEKLAENLFQTYRVGNSGISLDMDLEGNVFFDTDVAVPLGMIVNELISNSFKYAFPDRNKGTIRIKLFSEGVTNEPNSKEELKRKNTKYTLIVSDNGIGIPKYIDLENTDTLGLQLVSILVDQLDGKIKVERGQGTEFNICFNTQ
jgi:PAS domain S-box-containing protein